MRTIIQRLSQNLTSFVLSKENRIEIHRQLLQVYPVHTQKKHEQITRRAQHTVYQSDTGQAAIDSSDLHTTAIHASALLAAATVNYSTAG